MRTRGVVLAMAGVTVMAMFAAWVARAEQKSVPFFQKPSLTPQRDAEKRAAELGTPHALRPPEPVVGAPLRTVRVRVHGDLDYRAVTPHWQARLRTLLVRVNAFVEPGFSVHLEIPREARRCRAGPTPSAPTPGCPGTPRRSR